MLCEVLYRCYDDDNTPAWVMPIGVAMKNRFFTLLFGPVSKAWFDILGALTS
jgi:hypothetical protein